MPLRACAAAVVQVPSAPRRVGKQVRTRPGTVPPHASKTHALSTWCCPAGKHAYVCPGDQLLDVSWHWAANPVTHPLTRFLIKPSIPEAIHWVQTGLSQSGIFELKVRLRVQFWGVRV